MVDSILTRGEMERNLSQSVQAFYRNRLGCRTEKVSCHILGEQVAIAIRNPITPVETLLNVSTDSDFVQDLRDRIDTIIKQDLIDTIEKILGVEVIAMTINTTISSNLTGIVALLSQKPLTREMKHNHSKPRISKDT